MHHKVHGAFILSEAIEVLLTGQGICVGRTLPGTNTGNFAMYFSMTVGSLGMKAPIVTYDRSFIYVVLCCWQNWPTVAWPQHRYKALSLGQSLVQVEPTSRA